MNRVTVSCQIRGICTSNVYFDYQAQGVRNYSWLTAKFWQLLGYRILEIKSKEGRTLYLDRRSFDIWRSQQETEHNGEEWVKFIDRACKRTKELGFFRQIQGQGKNPAFQEGVQKLCKWIQDNDLINSWSNKIQKLKDKYSKQLEQLDDKEIKTYLDKLANGELDKEMTKNLNGQVEDFGIKCDDVDTTLAGMTHFNDSCFQFFYNRYKYVMAIEEAIKQTIGRYHQFDARFVEVGQAVALCNFDEASRLLTDNKDAFHEENLADFQKTTLKTAKDALPKFKTFAEAHAKEKPVFFEAAKKENNLVKLSSDIDDLTKLTPQTDLKGKPDESSVIKKLFAFFAGNKERPLVKEIEAVRVALRAAKDKEFFKQDETIQEGLKQVSYRLRMFQFDKAEDKLKELMSKDKEGILAAIDTSIKELKKLSVIDKFMNQIVFLNLAKNELGNDTRSLNQLKKDTGDAYKLTEPVLQELLELELIPCLQTWARDFIRKYLFSDLYKRAVDFTGENLKVIMDAADLEVEANAQLKAGNKAEALKKLQECQAALGKVLIVPEAIAKKIEELSKS